MNRLASKLGGDHRSRRILALQPRDIEWQLLSRSFAGHAISGGAREAGFTQT